LPNGNFSYYTWFKYLKTYFGFTGKKAVSEKPFLFLQMSVFKGVFERFVLSIGLILSFPTILIVFGTLKIATRFKDEEMKNDYFLIGNVSSILLALFYYYSFNSVLSQF
jgi:hypothetical protein